MDLTGALRRLLRRLRSSRATTAPSEQAKKPQDITLASVLAALRANRDYAREALARNPRRRTVERVIDDRVFILALDELYRTGMTRHEHQELLPAARALARALGITPHPGHVEGRYAADPLLVELFRTVRALQRLDEQQRSRVSHMPEFGRLAEVLASPLFGSMHRTGVLLPRGMDPLAVALRSASDWTLAEIVHLAHDVAHKYDDCSLIGMASAASDPVAMVAILDPTVLFYDESTFGNPPIPVYRWAMSPGILRRAERFAAAYNSLFDGEFPAPTRENADLFGAAYYERAGFVGRCVTFGLKKPGRGYYHWAIYSENDGTPAVHEFWSDEVWNTQRYRAAMKPDRKGRADLLQTASRS